MIIRLLHAEDAQAYKKLRLSALQECPSAFSASYEDEVDRSINDVAARIQPAADGSVCVLGVFRIDDLAGFVAIIHPPRAKLRHNVELAGMYVDPPCRRHGLGRGLLGAAIDHARSIDGVRQIKLGVNATNMAAKALYQSMGFERFGVEPDALNVDGRFYDEEHYMLRLNSSD